MKCPECHGEMQPGIVWLGIKTQAACVLFSPAKWVSWTRRLLAGSIFYGGPQEGEVEILSRSWTDKVGSRRAFHCRNCEIVVCDVGTRGLDTEPDRTLGHSLDR